MWGSRVRTVDLASLILQTAQLGKFLPLLQHDHASEVPRARWQVEDCCVHRICRTSKAVIKLLFSNSITKSSFTLPYFKWMNMLKPLKCLYSKWYEVYLENFPLVKYLYEKNWIEWWKCIQSLISIWTKDNLPWPIRLYKTVSYKQ